MKSKYDFSIVLCKKTVFFDFMQNKVFWDLKNFQFYFGFYLKSNFQFSKF